MADGLPDAEMLRATLGRSGRVLSYSRSAYRRDHPDHAVHFNAGICVARDGLPVLIWEGDLDLTLDEANLVAYARAVEETLYVLYEGERPDRFSGARGEALRRAALVVDFDGDVGFIGTRIRRATDGTLRRVRDESGELRSLVRALLAQKEALSAIVLRGVEQGWVTQGEHEAALRLREPQGQNDG